MESQSPKTLFDTYKMGDLTLPHRICASSIIQWLSDPKTGIPTEKHVKYFSERASAAFILTECSAVSNQGNAYLGSAGIWNKDQMENWKKVVEAVHSKGGLIVQQIWHAGRRVSPADSGEKSLAPSAIPWRKFDKDGVATENHIPTPMTIEDIKSVLEEFRQGALRSKEAGFDGIELHGANGYLPDEFLRDGSNQRSDEYGGSVENRARFILKIIDQLISVFGKGRVGIKLSPVGRFNDMFDSNPLETYTYLLNKLDEKGIAFVELAEAGMMSPDDKSDRIDGKEQIPEVAKTFRAAFKGTLITNLGHTPTTALEYINKGWADLVSFGNLFLNNPDLVERIKSGAELKTKSD